VRGREGSAVRFRNSGARGRKERKAAALGLVGFGLGRFKWASGEWTRPVLGRDSASLSGPVWIGLRRARRESLGILLDLWTGSPRNLEKGLCWWTGSEVHKRDDDPYYFSFLKQKTQYFCRQQRGVRCRLDV
jgi:hypothetical protein